MNITGTVHHVGGSQAQVPEMGQKGGEAMKWKPIETAPRDRDLKMLGLLKSGRVMTMKPLYRNIFKSRPDGGCDVVGVEFGGYQEIEYSALVPCSPTHWMPMPDSPVAPVQNIVRRLPNAVRQTKPTNCFQACVASVLGVPIEDVPEACDGATWDWDAFQDWLALRGLQAIEVGFGNGGTIYPVRKPVMCIVTGESPRECTTGRHAVVGELLGLEGFRLLHDPHPSELWIDGEPTHAVFFVSICEYDEEFSSCASAG